IDVVGFNETLIVLTTEGGRLTVEGEEIQITALDVESGKMTATGRFDSLMYGDAEKTRRGFFSRLLR
ncbi:MAG: sporulation protein YabP, partial [Oscillospiraceae bacterium]|nr:sporulation protein YabP [Oscillospiraceae bacterium]